MKLYFSTRIPGHYLEVMRSFDQALFEALAPPLIPMTILKFTGSKKGDEVHLKFGGLVGTSWVSLITEDGCDEEQVYFVDEGKRLPFPLKKWKHKHIVRKISQVESLIIDEIEYHSYHIILSWLLYPWLFLSFKPRSKIYQKYFQRLKSK